MRQALTTWGWFKNMLDFCRRNWHYSSTEEPNTKIFHQLVFTQIIS